MHGGCGAYGVLFVGLLAKKVMTDMDERDGQHVMYKSITEWYGTETADS